MSIVLASLAVGCDPPTELEYSPSRRFHPQPLFDSAFEVESASVVLPAGVNAACPDGAVVVTTGGGSAKVFTSGVPGNGLNCLGLSGCFEKRISSQDVLPYLGPPIVVSNDPDDTVAGTDTCNDPPSPGTESSDDRFSAITDSTITRIEGKLLWSVLAGKNRPPTVKPCNEGERYEGWVFMWVSEDCGQTWKSSGSVSDPEGKKYMDRQEVYHDPWGAGDFLTVRTFEGGVEKSAVYKSSTNDGGYWTHLSNIGTGDRIGPAVMTATPPRPRLIHGRQYFLQCEEISEGSDSWIARLYVSEDSGRTIQQVELTGNQNGKPILCDFAPNSDVPGLGNDGFWHFSTPSIARIAATTTADKLRASIPFTRKNDDGTLSQTFRMIRITVPLRDGEILPLAEVFEEPELNDPDGSVVQAHFVETDRFETPERDEASPATNRALLMWKASKYVPDGFGGNTPTMSSQYRMYVGDGYLDHGFLSNRVLNPLDPSSLVADWWFPRMAVRNDEKGKLEGTYGHYDYGSFFYDAAGKKYKYLAQWPQSVESATTANAQLYFNVIQTEP